MPPTLTLQQSQALDQIHRAIKNKERSFKLSGWAGTGKTTLLSHIINNMEGDVRVAAPTGKAASVLMKKLGGFNVTTIHSLLYAPTEIVDEKLFKLYEMAALHPEDKGIKEELQQKKLECAKKNKEICFTLKDHKITGNTIIFIDEASMTSAKIREDLLSTGAFVCFVGDAFQLPPPRSEDWFREDNVDYQLTEIHRQALDSHIIQQSMKFREGNIAHYAVEYPDLSCCHKQDLGHDAWLNADQIITGSNNSRRRINRFFRKKLGYDTVLPLPGEKLICLKNMLHEDVRYINGVQGFCGNTQDIGFGDTLCFYADVVYDNQLRLSLPLYRTHFELNYDPTLTIDPWFARRDYLEFDYAYAITCHKSQGSEWPTVIVSDDMMRAGDINTRKRWLYTAITRAKDKAIWVI